MKIKRFEAPQMAEALKQVKKEFGEDAVILSAKSSRPSGRLFGGAKTKKVVVTAAIDDTPMTGSQGIMTQATPTEAVQPTDQQAIGRSPSSTKGQHAKIWRQFAPITRTGQKKIKPRVEKEPGRSVATRDMVPGFEKELIDAGLVTDIARELDVCLKEMPGIDAGKRLRDQPQFLARALCSYGLCEEARPATELRRADVLVGPHGVGKTSTVAKLAAETLMKNESPVAVISMDNQKAAANTVLNRYLRIMNIPLITVTTGDEMAAAVQRLGDSVQLIVDTPGAGPNDQKLILHVKHLLRKAITSRVHLLLSATCQHQVLTAAAQRFDPLHVDRVLFTHLDECLDHGALINFMISRGLRGSYGCDGPDVPDDIHLLDTNFLARRLLNVADSDLARNEKPASPPVTVVRRAPSNQNAPYYVANRNSDIFHHQDCTAVKRIKSDNMMAFKGVADAIDRKFKPCRMCCSALVEPTPPIYPARYAYSAKL